MSATGRILLLPIMALATTTALLAQAPQSAPSMADTLFGQVRSVLEDAMNHRFTQPPRFRAASPAELRQLADAELEAQLYWQCPRLVGPERKDALAAAQEALAAVSIARHRPASDAILLPGHLPWLAQWVESRAPSGIPPAAFRKEFVQVSLVHEVVRMVLEQRYGLAQRWKTCRDAEEFRALQAVVEGRAMQITRTVAGRMGWGTSVPLLMDRLQMLCNARSDSPSPIANVPRLGEMEEQLLKQRHLACVAGLGMWDALEALNLQDAEVRLFNDPPRRMVEVQKPELMAQKYNRCLAAALFRLRESNFPPNTWQMSPEPWTPDMVRQVALLLKAGERAEQVLQSWQEGASLVGHPTGMAGPQLGIGVVRLNDAAAGRSYFGLTVDLQRKQDEVLNGSPASPQRVAKSRSQTVRLAGIDEGMLNEKEFEIPDAGQTLKVTTLLVRSGALVAQFTWRDLTADPEWAARFFAGLVADLQRRP
ncbi:MAG: hypothetical protein K2R98_19980 [Gemmataceae bacterium]|nr:hypothetical protein [Gemmataceae bacterium]